MKRILIVVLIVGCAATGFAFDYGFDVDNATMYQSEGQAQIINSLRSSLWTYVGRRSGTILNARVSFTNQAYGLVEETITPVEFPYMFDIDELNFAFGYPGGRVNLGRYVLTEPTRAVFSHKVDGISLTHTFAFLSFTARLGYTGLLWKNASTVSPSLMDINYAQSDDVILGARRLIGTFVLGTSAFANQQIHLGAIVQEDLRNSDGLIQEGDTTKQPGMAGLLDTQYLFLQVGGPILPILFYRVYGVYGAGRSLSYVDTQYEYSNISSVLAGVSTQLFLQEIAYSLIQFRAQFGTGDADATSFYESNTEGQLQTFISLTGSPSGIVFSPQPGNIALAEVSYSAKPTKRSNIEFLRTLQLVAKGLVFFRPTKGYISEAGIPSDATEHYLGTEADVLINARPFSDVGFSLSAGMFFPSTAFTSDGGGTPSPRISLRASVSMSM